MTASPIIEKIPERMELWRNEKAEDNKTTHILPFGELSPEQFERLCLWLVEREGYLRAEHLGEAGGELVRRETHCHTYYDHRKKLKINVSCLYDGGPLSVGFSTKYYGM